MSSSLCSCWTWWAPRVPRVCWAAFFFSTTEVPRVAVVASDTLPVSRGFLLDQTEIMNWLSVALPVLTFMCFGCLWLSVFGFSDPPWLSEPEAAGLGDFWGVLRNPPLFSAASHRHGPWCQLSTCPWTFVLPALLCSSALCTQDKNHKCSMD